MLIINIYIYLYYPSISQRVVALGLALPSSGPVLSQPCRMRPRLRSTQGSTISSLRTRTTEGTTRHSM